MKGISDGAVPPEGDVNQAENASESSTLSPSKEQGEEPEATEGNEIFLSCFWRNNNRHFLVSCFCCFLFFNCCILFSGQERASVIQLN